MPRKAKQDMCLTEKKKVLVSFHHMNANVYSPGLGTELVTDWGTFWLINSTQCPGKSPTCGEKAAEKNLNQRTDECVHTANSIPVMHSAVPPKGRSYSKTLSHR